MADKAHMVDLYLEPQENEGFGHSFETLDSDIQIERNVAPWESRFPELVRLWDMLEFYAKPFVIAVGKINGRMMHSEALSKCGYGNKPYPETTARLTLKSLERAASQCGEIGLDQSVQLLLKAKGRLEKSGDFTPGQFYAACNNILETIEYQLGEHRFAYVPIDRVRLIEEMEGNGPLIYSRFPTVEEDYREALYCYALDRHTACVFHCMLVLQPGLEALAKRLKVKMPKDWGSIIEKIEKEIDARRTKAAKGGGVTPRTAKARSELLTFCSEAATEFRHFKDAWRNHTSHGRRHYDKYESAKILTHVHDFMRHLALGLK